MNGYAPGGSSGAGTSGYGGEASQWANSPQNGLFTVNTGMQYDPSAQDISSWAFNGDDGMNGMMGGYQAEDYADDMIDPALLAMEYKPQPAPAQMNGSNNYNIAAYPTGNPQMQSYINQQPMQHQAYPPQPEAGPSTIKPNTQTIAPALLQQERKPTAAELQQIVPPAAPLSAKAEAKRPIRKEKFDIAADNRVFGEVAAEASFKASLSPAGPNHLTKLVELLRPRAVPEGASPTEAAELRKPRIVMAAETAKEVFERMNRSATTRYIKAWSKDPKALSVFAYYLEVANVGVPADKEFKVYMHAAHAILVMMSRMDLDLTVVVDLKLGMLSQSLGKKPLERFKKSNPMEANDMKKLIRKIKENLKDKVDAGESKPDVKPVAGVVKRERGPVDEGQDKAKKVKAEPGTTASKPKAPVVSVKPAGKQASSDSAFFSSAPARPAPVKVPPRPAPRAGVDSFASTLTRLAGAAGTAGQMALQQAAKAEEENARASTSKVRIGKDGKPKPVKNVTFKPEQDLVSIKWIEAREETEGHHDVSVRSLDSDEGLAMKRHVVEPDQAWYKPDELVDMPVSTIGREPPPELYSEDAREQTEREKQAVPAGYFDEASPCPDESTVRLVLVDERGDGSGKTLTMTSYRASAYEQPSDEWSAPYAGTPQGPAYVGSPFASAASAAPAPAAAAPPQQAIPDVANILKTLSSLTGMQTGIPAAPITQPPVPQKLPQQSYAPAAQDIGSLLANLGPAMGQMPAQPWQQYQQPTIMHNMSGAQAYPGAGGMGWAGMGAVDQDVNGMGRGGARGVRGRGGRGGYQAGPAPAPGTGHRVCKFFANGGNCRYGASCIDQHIAN